MMKAIASLSSDPHSLCRRRLAHLALAAGAMLWMLGASHAAWADVPGRVGRVSFIQGDVQSYSETEPEWKVSYPNQPITSHNSIFVGDSGRAEISVGSTTLAMDAGSQVDIEQLDDNTFNANVVRGRISLRIRRLDQNDQYNVAVPGADFALLQPGRYRVDALDGASGIAVFAGLASVQGDREPINVRAGNGMRVVTNPQDPDGPPQLLSAASVPVPLDDWVVAREDRFRSAQTERYVSPNMTGYEELEANGRWASEPEIGPVWYPTTYVRAGWAPYRYGRWAYVAPWGYTWIDDAPWGFAPFHYGRWLEVDGRWGWAPGAYVARPVYAPALVGFYGGSGFNASFSIGAGPAVGWYPLAPWERFNPHYTRDTVYVNRVNNITIVNAPNRFGRQGEWNRERGATIAPRDAFASQRSISQVAVAAPRNAFDRAGPVNGGELPRPSAVPGAVRRGPEGPGANPRPDFRSPRDFAERSGRGDPRAVEANRPQPGFVGGGPDPRSGDRGQPNDRRLQGADRPPAVGEASRPQPNFGVPTERGQDRGLPSRGPNPPNFNREPRPAPQVAAPTAEVPNPVAPNVDRFGPRGQAMQRGGGDERPPQQGERNREFRAPQPVPAAPAVAPQPQPPSVPRPAFERPQGVERPQAFERPQAVERPQRIERSVAPLPQAPAPAPVAAPVPQPRPQPAPQAQPPQPQPAQPRAAPPPGQGERGNERERRQPNQQER